MKKIFQARNSFIKIAGSFFLALALLPWHVWAKADTPTTPTASVFSQWEWRAKVLAGQDLRSDFVVLDIPSEVFSHSKSDLSDLRLGYKEEAVPYVLSVEKEKSRYERVPARMFNLSSIPGESTSFILDMGSAGIFHSSISIETASENFRKMVEIRGSNDQASWRILTSQGQIFDYTVRDIKPVSVRDTSVVYPESTFRYLWITIRDAGEPAIKVTGARVSREVASAAKELTYSPTLEVAENIKDKSTEIIFDLGARGIPHRRLRLDLGDTNFSRAVVVQDSDDKNKWRDLSFAYIYDIQTSKFSGRNVEFSYPESSQRYLRISILNRDDRALAVRGGTVFGVVRSILFSKPKGEDYYLYFGNLKVSRPEYDLEKISQYIESDSLDRVSVGSLEKNPRYIAPEPIKPPLTERSPYVLPVILGVVVAILAFLLLRLASKVKSDLPPLI